MEHIQATTDQTEEIERLKSSVKGIAELFEGLVDLLIDVQLTADKYGNDDAIGLVTNWISDIDEVHETYEARKAEGRDIMQCSITKDGKTIVLERDGKTVVKVIDHTADVK